MQSIAVFEQEGLLTFIEKLFSLELEGFSRLRRCGIRLVQFVVQTWTEFTADKCIIRAQGLAYVSLLALVPLIIVGFALFSAFSTFENIKENILNFLFSQILATKQDEILTYINQALSSTKAIGLVSFAFLIVTAVMLLDNIEKNFNDVWAVKARRKFINKFMAYTSVLIFGTIFLGASFSVTAKVKSMLKLEALMDIGLVSKSLLWLFPLVLTILGFLVMFMVIPYTKVKLKSAFIGAVTGGLLFEIAKSAFANSIGKSVKYKMLYGVLAAIPITLIWLYVVCIIVLIALEVTYTHQNFQSLILHRVYKDPSPRDRLALGLKFFALVARKFHVGGNPPTKMDIADRFLVPYGIVEDILSTFIDKGLLLEATGKNEGLVPARSLDQIKLREVAQAVYVSETPINLPHDPIDKALEEVVSKFSDAAFDSFGEMNLQDYIKDLPDSK